MACARALLSACIGIFAAMVTFSAGAKASQPEKVQAALETWLAKRALLEKVTRIAFISLGDPGPAVEAFAGTTGRTPSDEPISQDLLFRMGSTSNSFTGAVIPKQEAAGKLSLNDTIGGGRASFPAP